MTDELTPEERTHLESLSADVNPAADLEDRVVAELRHRGLIQGRSLWWTRLRVAAAAVVVFAAGGVVANLGLLGTPAPESDSGLQFVLLLLEPRGVVLDQDTEASRVQEYSEWAQRIAREGRLVGGEKLTERTGFVTAGTASAPEPNTDQTVSGFFIVRAPSFGEALALARECPHAKHGGLIEVRQIDEV